jgi:alpha-tubulin suppressor-like RCC1 family protein
MRPRRAWMTRALAASALVVMAALPSQAAAPVPAGTVYGFGSNYYGELGSATNNGSGTANPVPATTTLPGAAGGAVSAASGAYHSLVVTSSGQLFAFGWNGLGQLGNPSNNNNGMQNNAANATPTLVTLPGATGGVIQAAAGNAHSLAVTSTGQLYAFGYNFSGQLGIATNSGTTSPNPTPTLVSLPGATGGVVQVATGLIHSLALTSTGQVYAFGDNNYGELGVPGNSGNATANPTPQLVTLPGATGPVVQIAAGSLHSLALTSTGQLFAFGINSQGELGSATNNGAATANPTPALAQFPAGAGPIVRIAAGGAHTLALTSTGQLYAFGSNYYGQLGSAVNNGANTANPTPALVDLPGAVGAIVQIAAGNDHSLAVTSSGQLYAFGENQAGELGTGTNSGSSTAANPTPAIVGLPAGVTIDTVAQGSEGFHTLVIVANLAVASQSLPTGQVGTPYAASAAASGGTAPYRWAASGLPAGLAIDPSSGKISGTPTAATTAVVVLSVADADGISVSGGSLLLTIAPATASPPPPTVTAAQVKASLLSQLAPKGSGAKIAALLKARGYNAKFKALRTGVAAIDWYFLPKGARLTGTKIKPVLIARGTRVFKAAGTLSISVKLTARGRRALGKVRRLKISAKGVFTPQGAPAISATKTVTLVR